MKTIPNEMMYKYTTETFTFNMYDKNNIEEKELVESLRNDKEVMKYVDNFETLLNETVETKDDENMITFASIVKKDNEPIGMIAVVNNEGGNLVFSSCIDEKHRGKGYSRILKNEAFDYLFNLTDEIENIVSYIKKYNEKSLKTAMRLGFSKIENAQDDYYKIIIGPERYRKLDNIKTK